MKKLFTGILMVLASVLIVSNVGFVELLETKRYFIGTFFSFLPKSLAIVFGTLASMILPALVCVFFVKGIYRIVTCNMYIREFEKESAFKLRDIAIGLGNINYPNIDRVLSYRESKMSNMTSNEAADYLVATSRLDALRTGYNQGPNTQRAISYLESKLNNMDNEKALDYLTHSLK